MDRRLVAAVRILAFAMLGMSSRWDATRAAPAAEPPIERVIVVDRTFRFTAAKYSLRESASVDLGSLGTITVGNDPARGRAGHRALFVELQFEALGGDGDATDVWREQVTPHIPTIIAALPIPKGALTLPKSGDYRFFDSTKLKLVSDTLVEPANEANRVGSEAEQSPRLRSMINQERSHERHVAVCWTVPSVIVSRLNRESSCYVSFQREAPNNQSCSISFNGREYLALIRVKKPTSITVVFDVPAKCDVAKSVLEFEGRSISVPLVLDQLPQSKDNHLAIVTPGSTATRVATVAKASKDGGASTISTIGPIEFSPKPWVRSKPPAQPATKPTNTNSKWDVLVTKSGKRYEGTLSETGTSFTIRKPTGEKLSWPKAQVQEVERAADRAKEYEQRLAKADLTDAAQVRPLIELVEKSGLTRERAALVKQTFQDKFAKSKDSLSSVSELGRWCREAGLHEEAAQCQSQAVFLEFHERYRAAAGKPLDLVDLCHWSVRKGFDVGARETAKEAIAKSPTPNDIRNLLGWSASVQSVSVQALYVDPLSGAVRDPGPERQFVKLVLDVTALSPSPEPFEERFERMVSDSMAYRFLVQGKSPSEKDSPSLTAEEVAALRAIPSRVFYSQLVTLWFKEQFYETRKSVEIEPPVAPGFTLFFSTAYVSETAGTAATLRYVPGASIMRVGVKERMTCTFEIPKSLTEATLEFYFNDPVKITIPK